MWISLASPRGLLISPLDNASIYQQLGNLGCRDLFCGSWLMANSSPLEDSGNFWALLVCGLAEISRYISSETNSMIPFDLKCFPRYRPAAPPLTGRYCHQQILSSIPQALCFISRSRTLSQPGTPFTDAVISGGQLLALAGTGSEQPEMCSPTSITFSHGERTNHWRYYTRSILLLENS